MELKVMTKEMLEKSLEEYGKNVSKILGDILKPVSEEKKKEPVKTMKEVETILSKETSNKINDMILEMATMVRDDSLDSNACNSALDMFVDSMRKAKKQDDQKVSTVEAEIVPFEEDKKPKQNKDEEIIDVDAEVISPEQPKKKEKKTEEKKNPEDAMEEFDSNEEAEKKAEEQTKKELLFADILPPVQTIQIPVTDELFEITNQSVLKYLTDSFAPIFKDEPFKLWQHSSGLFVIEAAGHRAFVDNNTIIKQHAQLIVDVCVFNEFGPHRQPEFVSVKMRPDIVYQWMHDPNLRATGITDPETINNLVLYRKIPTNIIYNVDLSTAPQDIAENKEFLDNLVNLFNHPELKIVPGVRFRLKVFKTANKFTLVSDSKVKSPLIGFNSSARRYANPELTIAFNNKENIKIMYNGYKKVFSLSGAPVEEKAEEKSEA